MTTISPVHDPMILSSNSPVTVVTDENVVERTLLSIQEKVMEERELKCIY